MLVADLVGLRIEANIAEKGPEYRCPKCRDVVILKKGRIKTHHFAHKPPINCSWGKGETHEHREAKKLFKEEFLRRELRAEVEHEIQSLPDDRRADVVVWSPQGHRFALELQHTGIDYDNLERRTRSYITAGVPVIWIPFLPAKHCTGAVPLGPGENGDYRIERFPARPLEKWVHGFYFGEPWMYDPKAKALWKYKLDEHQIYVDHTSWYDSDGEEHSAGGYWRPSKRWRKLTLWGPYRLDQVRVDVLNRQATVMGNHRYPGGRVGKLVLLEG